MKNVAYIRVSSKTQSYDSQRHAIEARAKADGVALDDIYEEKVSAKTLGRPELARLRQDVRDGRIKRVYVFRLDRLARSGIRDTVNVVGEMRDHGVQLVTAADGFDLAGPWAEIIVAVMGWAAGMELNARNERIAAAKAKAAAEGRKLGRPTKDRTIEASAKAKELHAQGMSIVRIAQALGVPRSTVARLVKPATPARAAS